MAKDYYETLGLSKDATTADIKKAYRDLSKKWHPDKHKGDKSAEEKFKEINQAYEVLGNEDKRKQYDQFGSVGGGQGGFGGFDFSGFQQGGGFEGFGDIFESFFGGGGTRRTRERATRGQDLRISLTIDFAEAVSGVKKTVTLDRQVVCAACEGKGAAKGSSLKTCDRCGGTGQVTHTAQSFFGTIRQAVLCDVCEGAGQVPEKPCPECGGDGRKRERSSITIDIPAGIADGQMLKVREHGEAGKRGAATGDLLVEIVVRQDPRFERAGDDIQSHTTISVPDAALGTEIDIDTVHGKTRLKIPAGTQSGQVFRVKGKGMPVVGTSRTGDHYVTVTVEIPKKLSRSERKILEEWQKLNGA